MPYRRLPKTDKSRLAALKTLLDNNNIYTARDRFIDWKDINNARTCYDRLLTLVNQYDMDKQAQSRGRLRLNPLQRNATMYLSHFMQVFKMCVERGESDEDTARREVLEEAGIRIKIIPGFKCSSEYMIQNKVEKTVNIFVATTDDTNTVIQESEIEDYAWLSYRDSLKRLRFDNDKKILTDARSFLISKGIIE